jgi:hypothetical protein
MLVCPQRIARIREATDAAYRAYMLHTPAPTSLHTLIRLNVLHGIARNAKLMGFWEEGLCKDDFVSPFNEHGPLLPFKADRATRCPPALTPTTVQRSVVHHPWIDLFPFPDFRDRILLSLDAGQLDEDALCLDILEVDGRDINERPALIIWSDSSDPSAWEVSVGFLRKWGWLVQGCRELMEATIVGASCEARRGCHLDIERVCRVDGNEAHDKWEGESALKITSRAVLASRRPRSPSDIRIRI